MAFVEVEGSVRLYYRLEGAEGLPVVMLVHSLGLDHGIWAAQAADLLPYFRVLRCDIRGHGASDSPPGDYTIAQLGRDALEVASAVDIGRFAFCGLSIGGMIGQWIAVHAADRLTHLVLANTTPRLDDPAAMESRRVAVLDGGMASVVDTAMARFFTPELLQSSSHAVASARRTFLATNPIGYAGCCAAIRDVDHSAVLPTIGLPTLVISGDRDVSTPWETNGAVLARSIPGARVVRLPAAHVSNLERPRAFSAALLEFLLPSADGSLDAGMRRRREMLGDAHVERSVASATDFTREFQELITRVAWGTIWSRPALDARTRRLLVLTTTAALGRWDEFRLHVRAGFAAGMEECDVKEALLQVAVYAGVPAANTAFHIAGEELQAPRS